ncbi:putative LOC100569746 [Trichonephila clavipes]|nr:putative LOC100569746 [Trichonephila clavipes]
MALSDSLPWCPGWNSGGLHRCTDQTVTLAWNSLQLHVSSEFQQDGATCPTARATIDLLKDTFGDRLISRFGPVNWPPRSYDLTPLDYFLWGYVKSLVYADKPQTLDHLEDNIHRVITDIRPQMLEKVIENWTSRLDYIRASRGSPMLEIIFKMSSGGVVAYRVSQQQVLGSILGLGKVNSDLHPFSGSINEYQACLETKTLGVSLQTDHLIVTSAHVPQRPMGTILRWA